MHERMNLLHKINHVSTNTKYCIYIKIMKFFVSNKWDEQYIMTTLSRAWIDEEEAKLISECSTTKESHFKEFNEFSYASANSLNDVLGTSYS